MPSRKTGWSSTTATAMARRTVRRRRRPRRHVRHGSTASTTVPVPCVRRRDQQRPAGLLGALPHGRGADPGDRTGRRAAAVVRHTQHEVVAATADGHRAAVGAAVPDRVGHRLGEDPVGRAGQGGRRLRGQADVERRPRSRAAPWRAASSCDRRGQAELVEHRRQQVAGQGADVLHPLVELDLQGPEDLGRRGGVAAEQVAGARPGPAAARPATGRGRRGARGGRGAARPSGPRSAARARPRGRAWPRSGRRRPRPRRPGRRGRPGCARRGAPRRAG